MDKTRRFDKISEARIMDLIEQRFQLKEEFNAIGDDVEKVRSIQNTDYFKSRYRQAIKYLNEPRKSAIESDGYREKGNYHYAEGKFILALEYFNVSICYALKNSEQLAKSYANRSAVYFSMKKFDFSLNNIKMAREAGYPERLALKLNEREVKCVSELKKLETKPKNEFHGLKPELSYPPHEKVPFIANGLDLKVNEKYGRHVVTKCNLKVGDVVAIEQPFCAAISSGFRYLFCANCFRENDLDLIPCPNCHSAMFCSPECLAAANEAFHAIECPIMDVFVQSTDFDDNAYIAFRLFILAMKNFDVVDKLKKFMQDLENREQNVFNVDYKEKKNIDLLASALKLKVIQQGSRQFSVQKNLFTTALISEIVLNLTDFKESFKSDNETNFLINFIFHLNKLTEDNTFGGSNIRKIVPEMTSELKFRTDRSCFGIYPFSSLLNHSCAPNVKVFKHSTENVIIAIKPIKSGEQLFHHTVYHHNKHDRKLRQAGIFYNLMFTCDCVACIRDYPQLKQEDMKRNHGFIEPLQHEKLCNEYKIDAIQELIPKYCHFLNDNSKDFPYNHTNVAEQILLKCLCVIYTDQIQLIDKLRLQLN